MRICTWLTLATALAACGGDEFTETSGGTGGAGASAVLRPAGRVGPEGLRNPALGGQLFYKRRKNLNDPCCDRNPSTQCPAAGTIDVSFPGTVVAQCSFVVSP